MATNIVHQLGDLLYETLPPDVAHEHFVKARQATNDRAIDFAEELIEKHLTTREAEVSRRLAPFLEGYREGVIEDYSTTKEVKLAKLQVLKDIMKMLPTNPKETEQTTASHTTTGKNAVLFVPEGMSYDGEKGPKIIHLKETEEQYGTRKKIA